MLLPSSWPISWSPSSSGFIDAVSSPGVRARKQTRYDFPACCPSAASGAARRPRVTLATPEGLLDFTEVPDLQDLLTSELSQTLREAATVVVRQPIGPKRNHVVETSFTDNALLSCDQPLGICHSRVEERQQDTDGEINANHNGHELSHSRLNPLLLRSWPERLPAPGA